MRIPTILIILLLFPLWLSGCATSFAPQPPQNQFISWENRAQALEAVQTWDITGVIALRTRSEAISASLEWQQNQNPKNYVIQLFGPLGANAIKLTSTSTSVLLETADGKKFTAASPELLLAQQLHWNLPVSNLYYWIRGLPVPNLPTKKRFDQYHHLSVLEQQGWTVQFLRYVSVNQIDMPNKIVITHPKLTVKIIIHQLTVGTSVSKIPA